MMPGCSAMHARLFFSSVTWLPAGKTTLSPTISIWVTSSWSFYDWNLAQLAQWSFRNCLLVPVAFINRESVQRGRRRNTQSGGKSILRWRTAGETVLSRWQILRGAMTFLCYAMFFFLYLIITGFIMSFFIQRPLLFFKGRGRTFDETKGNHADENSTFFVSWLLSWVPLPRGE